MTSQPAGPDFAGVLSAHRLRQFDQPVACICGWDWSPRASFGEPGRTDQHAGHVVECLNIEWQRWFAEYREDERLEYLSEMERLDQ